jgi:hypothetical protein
MTQKFVRYSPDVEQNEPDFDRTLQTVLDNMKQHMLGSLQAEGIWTCGARPCQGLRSRSGRI